MRTMVLWGVAVWLTVAPAPAWLITYFEEEFHQTYELAADGRISLDNINGDVYIAGWDRNQVRVDAVISATVPAQLEEARIVVQSAPDAIAIGGRYPGVREDTLARIEFHITVPRHARLDEIRLVNGQLEIEGIAGDVRASSVNGGMRACNLAGVARLSTVNGRLEAAFDRLHPSKPISLDSVNGSIEVTLPMGAAAEFQAHNVSGGIDNDFGLPVVHGPVAGSHLRAAIRRGGARIRIRNVNGPISIQQLAGGRRVRET